MKSTNTAAKFSKKVVMSGIAISVATFLCLGQVLLVGNGNSKAYATPDSVSALQAQINEQQPILDQASAEYGDALAAQEEAQAKVDEAQAIIDEATGKKADVQGDLAERVRSMYRNRSNSFLEMILGATTFREVANTFDILNRFNNQNAELIKECTELTQKIEEQKATLDENLAIASENASKAYAAKSSAESIIGELQSKINQLNAEEQARLQEQQQEESGGGGGGGGGYDPATGNAVVDRALSQCGKPYVWGGVGPAGYDCSGLVSYALTGAHCRIGTTTTFMGWPRVSDPQPGDVCTSWDHCGIYYGGGRMVHAPTFGCVVCVAGVQSGMVYVRQ